MAKKLRQSSQDRILAGVIGGFGTYFGIDATLLRILFVLLLLMTGLIPGAVLYLVAAILMPNQ